MNSGVYIKGVKWETLNKGVYYERQKVCAVCAYRHGLCCVYPGDVYPLGVIYNFCNIIFSLFFYYDGCQNARHYCIFLCGTERYL